MPNITDRPLPEFGGQTIHDLWKEGGMRNPAFVEASKHLLHQWRKIASTYETRPRQGAHQGDDTTESFKGAAIIRTRDNHFFISANQHNRRQPDINQCAELNAKTEADNDPDVTDSRIGDLMFLGGKAIVHSGEIIKNIKESHKGARHTPCGACRDMIIDFSDPDAPAQVHIYPLLDVSEELVPYDTSVSAGEMPKNMIRSYNNPNELQPLQEYPLAGQRDDFNRGLHALKLEPAGKSRYRGAAGNGRVTSLASTEKQADPKTGKRSGFDRADFTQRLYNVMFQTLRREIHQQGRKALSLDTLDDHYVSIAIARTNQGEYFIGSYFEGAEKQSFNGGALNAIQNSRFSGGITDVFFLQIDFRTLRQELEQGKDIVTIPMPDGHSLQGINKARKNAIDSALKPVHSDDSKRHVSPFQDKGGAPRIHMFSLVPPREFQISKHMHSHGILELMPDIWINPKGEPEKSVQSGAKPLERLSDNHIIPDGP